MTPQLRAKETAKPMSIIYSDTETVICTNCGGGGDVPTHRDADGWIHSIPCTICEGTGMGSAAPLTPAEEEALAEVNPLGPLTDITIGELTARHNLVVAGRLVVVNAVDRITEGASRVFACELDGSCSFVFVSLNSKPVQVASR